MCVDQVAHITNSIIRYVTQFSRMLLVTSDNGQITLLDGGKVQFIVNSESPIYNIVVIDDNTFVTAERNGAIKEWKYLSKQLFFSRTLAIADGCIFSLVVRDDEYIGVGSKGKKYVFEVQKKRLFDQQIAPCNIFCIADGPESELYYGLANGSIICERKNQFSTFVSHQDAVRDIVFSPEKRWMFSISKDNTVRAWRDGIPHLLALGHDYLYKIIVEKTDVYYVDGHGDLGRIVFDGHIDNAKEIKIIT